MAANGYRGRLAPTPTGDLHLGHALTFHRAWERVRDAHGALILRVEDLDAARCRPEYVMRQIEDLLWLGIQWQEGPDLGGPYSPYRQSERLAYYREIWRLLQERGAIYPSPHSRKDVETSLNAPHEAEGETIFPVSLRPHPGEPRVETEPGEVNWRFRVPDGELIEFQDGTFQQITRIAGEDFGDFLVWRKDGFPSYELAVVADDYAMGITEVVRGEDLLTSTARQLLLYRALGWVSPAFNHCPLVRSPSGERLAKRSGGYTIREFREQGYTSREVLSLARSSVRS